MKLRKTVALYFSPTHTTEKSVKTFAVGTGLPVETIDLTTLRQRTTFKRNIDKDELLVVGFPVYAGRLPAIPDDFFPNLSSEGGPAVVIVVYGNRDYDDSLLELKLRLEERGFKVRAAATFIGEHTRSSKIATGRPDANDLVVASDFGKKTFASITKDAAGELILKGSYPFTSKVMVPNGISPNTSDNCILCGICIDECPWGAVDSNDCKKTDGARCMRCARCIRECPEGARSFTDPGYLSSIPDFEKRLNARRCEPELFLPLA
jgi:ferredoxin